MASPSLPLPTWRLHPKRRSDSPTRSVVAAATSEDHSLRRKLSSWNARIESLASLEARGISRVPLTERHEASTAQYRDMALIWISANLSANNLAVGLLGPLVFGLGFLDAALCAIFGVILGAAGSAYYSTWGPGSGLRSMIIARFFMGYYPGKIAVALHILGAIGYGVVDCIIGGQILSATADGSMSVVVGIIIVGLLSWIVAVFGMSIFYSYQRWAWLPQVIALFVLAGSAGPKFNTTIQSKGDPITINANRLSFLSLCLSPAVSWTSVSADFYVYYPEKTPRMITFTMTLAGIVASKTMVYLLGIGLATSTFGHPSLATAYETSSGALIVASYDGLGGFGKFCGVIVALGEIANNVPSTYSAALGFQTLAHSLERIPRWVWVCVSAVVSTTCALGGRNKLLEILQNFLAVVGYWVTIFLSIVLEEHLFFKRTRPFDWTAWSDWRRLPLGIAALSSFLIGWAGTIVGMDQIWYKGPIGAMVGRHGADLGIWLGCGFALVVYPPMRAVEVEYFGR